jgi:6-pyruvoyltetrahydropterin/6-carboxytetrahydropterin synthase
MEKLFAHAHFHTAHRQLDYDGKCRFVHGHTWHGEITVQAESFPRDEKLDITLDFGRLKDILKNFDHKMLVSSRDELFLNSDLFEPEGIVVMPGRNPSVENVATYTMNETIDVLAKHFTERKVEYWIEVKIQETDNNIYTIDRTVTI